MDYREKYKMVKKLLIINMIALCIALIYITTKNDDKLTLPKPTNTIDTIKIEGFSEAKLIEFMDILEIEYPSIVLAQAKHETGNYTSNRFIKYNALFGFQTSDTSIIKYKSWKESVIAYKCWQMKRLKPDENYYDFLVRVKYSQDSSYINKLKQY
jgi:hypothetical protein